MPTFFFNQNSILEIKDKCQYYKNKHIHLVNFISEIVFQETIKYLRERSCIRDKSQSNKASNISIYNIHTGFL